MNMNIGDIVFAVVMIIALTVLGIILILAIYHGILESSKPKKKIDLSKYKGKHVAVLISNEETIYRLSDLAADLDTFTIEIEKLQLTKDNKFMPHHGNYIPTNTILEIDEIEKV